MPQLYQTLPAYPMKNGRTPCVDIGGEDDFTYDAVTSMATPRSILIISYIFPPFPSVGGRRWLKFAKYLSRKKIDVHVIHAKNPRNETSPWTQELKHLHNVKLHPIPACYPRMLFTKPLFFHQKALYKTLAYVFSKIVKGHFFDWSVFWKRSLLRKAESVIKNHAIDTVIASGPPFRYLHHTLSLKKKFPKIRLIADLRDPWVERLVMRSVPPERISHEMKLEQDVIVKSDAVFTVNDTNTENLKNRYPPDYHRKIHTIPNGFDPDDMPERKIADALTSESIKLIYAGELYSNMHYLVDPFVSSLKKTDLRSPRYFPRVQVDFFGEQDGTYELSNITCHPTTTVAQLSQRIQDSHACLLFLPDEFTSDTPTKFAEYIGHQKPILLISKYGLTAQLIEKYKLGFWLDPQNMDERLGQALESLKRHKTDYDPSFNRNELSIPNITEDILRIIW